MWLGFWHKYGVDVYLRLASCAHDDLIDFFGRYDIIADVINYADKEELYCYIARFIHLLKKKLHPALVAFSVCLMGIWPRDPLH